MKLNITVASLILLSFSACQKDIDQPNNATKTVTFNIGYNQTRMVGYELIITETTGELLLDTIIFTSNKIAHTVNAKGDAFNITTIGKDSAGRLTINTFKGVNSVNWDITPFPFKYAMHPGTPPSGVKNSITYTNIPTTPPNSNMPAFVFTTLFSRQATTMGFNMPYSISVEYDRTNPPLTLVIIPGLKLYKLHEANSASSTIDLAKMDTAVSISYSKGTGYNRYLSLWGYPTAGDYQNWVHLFYPLFILKDTVLFYPKSNLIKEYELTGQYQNSKETYEFYNLANSVPTSINFLDSTYFTSSYNNKKFQISFPKDKPTYYSLRLISANFSWNVYVPLDETTLDVQELINTLKTQWINKSDLENHKLNSVMIDQITDFTYPAVLDYIYNPKELEKKKIKTFRTYRKYL